MPQTITKAHIEKALTYTEYIKKSRELLKENKTTSPEAPTEELLDYTKLNDQRISRIEKTIHLQPELIEKIQNISAGWYWVVLAESWCGDVAQNLPIIAKMTDASPGIELCVLLRDTNPDVMDAYLTNGGRSIPKLICLKQDDLSEIGKWGPRPEPVQQMMLDYKKNPELPYMDFVKSIHNWYAKDKGITLQKEFLALLDTWSKS